MGWTAVLCSRTGEPIAELPPDFTLRFERNRAASARPTLDHGSPAGELLDTLATGLPQLRVYLDGELWLSGRWAPQRERSPANDPSTLEAEFRSPFGGLERRYLRAGDVTFTNTDAGQIAASVINTQNGYADTGILVGTIEPTVSRDRTYDVGKEAAEAIVQLTEVQGGFDFTETPLDPRSSGGKLSLFDVLASLGTDRSGLARFEQGPGTLDNTAAIERDWLLPINRATVGGAPGSTAQVATDQASIDKYGLWEQYTVESDVSEAATLAAKAAALLRLDPVQIVRIDPDPDGGIRPKADYWLGDTISVKANRDAFQLATTIRVDVIEITVAGGIETAHRVEGGQSRTTTLADVIRDLKRRTAALER